MLGGNKERMAKVPKLFQIWPIFKPLSVFYRPSPMLQVRTGPNQVWDIEYQTNGSITVDNAPFNWDVVPLGAGRYHILYEGRSYSAELITIDYAAKALQLKLNNRIVDLQAKDRFDLLLDKLGMSNAATSKVHELKAPMPGLIVDIRVETGQTVQKGDPLLVLEAMKMENILKAPSDVTIGAIKINLRDNVQKGQVLVQFT
ncbi:acetyl-CoA carboxylase biotin carboxyl carrier protein subunit [Hymenobacter qilianensis]|uniref:Acetyl-CoA carboxylase biotin carboxyl carrier protein subunit n=1 Tax=Hymenobacter qilianensis TaxID=1385715 RepID=A0ACB5PM63_9BACT|nr:acetyl-CoA carboxylase biotin carboxyl carrier protein subunit [Hymenobacter qilianensis]